MRSSWPRQPQLPRQPRLSPGGLFSGLVKWGVAGVFSLAVGVTSLCESLHGQCFEQRIDPVPPHDTGYYGSAVDLRGHRAVITSLGYEASVLEWNGSRWVVTALLSYEGEGYTLSFGYSVAQGHDLVAVGDPSDTYQGHSAAGTVHVFRRLPSGWERETVLGAPDAHAYAHFGSSVALFSSDAGDLLVAGAPETRVGSKTPGKVYLFRCSSGDWSLETELLPSNMVGGESFGAAVTTDGERVVVGGPTAESTARQAGSAYVYVFNGAEWVEEATLHPSSGDDAYDHFGQSVAIQGERLIVGVPGEDIGEGAAGALACFVRSDGEWVNEALLVGSNPEAGRQLGYSLDLDAERILAGGGNGSYGRGDAVLFVLDGGEWREVGSLLPPDQLDLDKYGWAVALDGGGAIVGAPGKSRGKWKCGVAYSWVMPDDGPAWWVNYGEGWPGTQGVPDLMLSEDPRLGGETDLLVGSSPGIPTIGELLVGRRASSADTGLDGRLLVVPEWTIPLVIPGQGLVEPLSVPCGRGLAGFVLYAQVLEEDRGATRGVSFSKGLALGIGF